MAWMIERTKEPGPRHFISKDWNSWTNVISDVDVFPNENEAARACNRMMISMRTPNYDIVYMKDDIIAKLLLNGGTLDG